MTQTNGKVYPISPLDKIRQVGLVFKGDADRRLEEARRTAERINTYAQVVELVHGGAATLANSGPRETRGFFVRSYAHRIDSPSKSFEFEEFHIPAFSPDPAASNSLPANLKGSADEILQVPCRTDGCKNAKTFVVGVLAMNKVGYHGAPSSVTFFAICPTCVTATLLDGGLPVERDEPAAKSA